MSFIMQPWHLLVVILAGWINRHQQAVIEFQGTQIQVRRRLAVKGKILGRKALTVTGVERRQAPHVVPRAAGEACRKAKRY
jgi:hypothetical protein